MEVKVKAGDGDNDVVSFHREKCVTAGGPDGDDGGRDGNVVFQMDKSLSTLADFHYKRKYIAENGQSDMGKRCSGRGTPDPVTRVPQGALARDLKSGRLLVDLSTDRSQIIARGGNGGQRNTHFATPTWQAPRFVKPDQPGKASDVQLELKLLADIGPVGFPNVGKSTLVSVVNEARPNVTNYHFTTITPVLGVVSLDEGQSLAMVDAPGLIKGTEEGAGLGHQFLRHVECCRLLVHIVGVTSDEGRDPKEDLETIDRELKKFNGELSEHPMLVAGNKYDPATEEQTEELRCLVEEQGYEFFPIIATIRYGVDPLLKWIQEKLSQLLLVIRSEPDSVPLLGITPEQAEKFTVTNQDGIFVVEGERLLQLLRSVNFDDYESLQYFQRVLTSSGVIDALRETRTEGGDTVSMYGLELDSVEQGA